MQKSESENWGEFFDHMDAVVNPQGITVEQCRERLAILQKDRAVIDQRIASVERLIERGGIAPTAQPTQEPRKPAPLQYRQPLHNPMVWFLVALVIVVPTFLLYLMGS